MQIITRQTNAKLTYDRYAAQYPRNIRIVGGRNSDDVKAALKGLTDPDVVDSIIGHKGWTEIGLCCDECHDYVDRTILLGESTLCLSCVRKALDALQYGQSGLSEGLRQEV